jgi:hypothetical protein
MNNKIFSKYTLIKKVNKFVLKGIDLILHDSKQRACLIIIIKVSHLFKTRRTAI